MFEGSRVRIRQFGPNDLELVAEWALHPEIVAPYNNFGLVPLNDTARGYQNGGWIGEEYGRLLVETLEGEVVGDVSYHQTRYGPNRASAVYNIGINLLPSQRSKGYGSEAQKLLAEYLFRTYPIMRVEAATDITNIPEQRSLEKAGFTREGVLRKAQWRDGDWHDLVLYSKLRGE